MKKEQKYIIKFINAKNQDGTVWYSIQVFNAKDDQSWNFRQRYSHMRDIHQRCALTNKRNDLPEFPHKKLFGNTKEDFIQKRKKQLENYYNTLLDTVDIQEMPQLLEFFNTNKPKSDKKVTPTTTIDKEKQTKNQKNKQLQLKKKLDQIAKKTEQQFVDCQDFNHQIDQDARKRYNQEFQKMKLDLKSKILFDGQQVKDKLKLKGCKDIEDYWAFQFKDNYESSFNLIENLCKDISEKGEEKGKQLQHANHFVVVL